MLERSVPLVLTQIQYIDFARLLAVEKGKQEKKTNVFVETLSHHFSACSQAWSSS